ncbi:MAG: hypothetical protein FWF09_00085 [Bacteroidales bacterium]|nr:hypothetical protein [Bacteroidales bacterium]
MALKKIRNYFCKHWWITGLLVFSISGIAFGLCGFDGSWKDKLYKTLLMLVFHPPQEIYKDSSSLNCPLELARWLTFAAFAWAASRLFLVIIAPKWLQSQIRHIPRFKQRYLFVGFGEQAKILAKNLKKKPCRCIFLVPKEKENDKALFDELRSMKTVVLYTNFEENIVRFPEKIDKFFFVEDDEDFNMKTSVKLLEQLKSKTLSKEVNIYVRAKSEQFYSHIENELKLDNKRCENIEFHIFNQPDLIARLFVKENPMLNSPNIEINHKKLHVKGNFNVLFLGFGWQGQELLKKCICDSQFVGSTFQATIVDNDYETHYGDYPILYDECITRYNLQFKTEAVGSKAFYEWLNAHICETGENGNFNRIIISLGDDSVNIGTAKKIAKIFHKHGILNTRKIVFALVQQLKTYSNDFTAFGKLADIYTEEVIVHEKMDIIAKMVAYVYSRNEKVSKIDWQDANKEWKETKNPVLFNKDSSRAVGTNIENLRKIAGKDVAALNEAELNIIAENEHLRWNAFHFVNGIRKWDLNEINTENAKLKDKNDNLLRHGCLVSFSELDMVSAKVNEIRAQKGTIQEKADYAETDRRIVRHIPLFLNEIKKKENQCTPITLNH